MDRRPSPGTEEGDTEGSAPPGVHRSVVVPAIAVPSSVACIRSLGRKGIRTIAVSERQSPPAMRSRYCDEAITVPDPSTNLAGYRDALLRLARRPDVATILPVREEDVFVLAQNRQLFRESIGTPWPDLTTLATVQDRVALFELAAEAGVPTPTTRLLTDDASWDRRWIVKSRYSIMNRSYTEQAPSNRCVSPPTTTYLRPGAIPDLDTLVDRMGHVPLLQEFVPTTIEYGFFALYDEGEPIATFQHRQHRGYSYAGGASAYRESVAIPELERTGRRLLDALDWHGVAMVEFLKDPSSGEFLLMEINPRLWSSLPFSVRAGADFPHYLYALATDNAGGIDPGYERGLAGHLIRGELLYLLSILVEDNDLVDPPPLPGAIADVVGSMIAHPRFDYLVRDDPWPFVRDLRLALGEAAQEVTSSIPPGKSSRPARDESTDHRHPNAENVLQDLDRDPVVGLEAAAETHDGDRGETGTRQKHDQSHGR